MYKEQSFFYLQRLKRILPIDCFKFPLAILTQMVKHFHEQSIYDVANLYMQIEDIGQVNMLNGLKSEQQEIKLKLKNCTLPRNNVP